MPPQVEHGVLLRGESLSRRVVVNAWSLAFSPDGQYIATGSFGGKVDLYNSDTGQKEMTLDTQTKFVLSAIYVNSRALLRSKSEDDHERCFHCRVPMGNYSPAVHRTAS